jgi:hypothetical protein
MPLLEKFLGLMNSEKKKLSLLVGMYVKNEEEKFKEKYSETSIHRSRYRRSPACIVCLIWSRN